MAGLPDKVDAFVKRRPLIPLLGVTVLTLGSLYMMADMMRPQVIRQHAFKYRVESMNADPSLRVKEIPVTATSLFYHQSVSHYDDRILKKILCVMTMTWSK
jgi:hypothetical protein